VRQSLGRKASGAAKEKGADGIIRALDVKWEP